MKGHIHITRDMASNRISVANNTNSTIMITLRGFTILAMAPMDLWGFQFHSIHDSVNVTMIPLVLGGETSIGGEG